MNFGEISWCGQQRTYMKMAKKYSYSNRVFLKISVSIGFSVTHYRIYALIYLIPCCKIFLFAKPPSLNLNNLRVEQCERIITNIFLFFNQNIYRSANLTFKSLRLTLCTTSFNIQKFCVLPTMHLCVLRGSQNKQTIFLYTAITYRFLQPRRRVFSARYELGL